MRPRLRTATRLKGNMADIAGLVEQLGKLTVIEAADLVKQLETAWGVTAAAPAAAAAPPPPPPHRPPKPRHPSMSFWSPRRPTRRLPPSRPCAKSRPDWAWQTPRRWWKARPSRCWKGRARPTRTPRRRSWRMRARKLKLNNHGVYCGGGSLFPAAQFEPKRSIF
jgi:hypothetical protein